VSLGRIETIGTVSKSKEIFIPGETCKGEITIRGKYLPCLKGLSEFSHILVIFSFSRPLPTKLEVNPMRNPKLPKIGVFATRSPYRPTKLGVSTLRLLEIEGNILKVSGLDALPGTPILDIKPYIPSRDSPKMAKVPAWIRKELAENGETRVR